MITDWIILLILIGEVALCMTLDKIAFGTWMSPFSLLAVPYTIVLLSAYFFAPALGFINLYVESALVWVVGLLAFWLGGVIIALSLGKSIRAKVKTNHPFLYEHKSEKLALILSWVSIPLVTYHLFTSLGSVGGLSGMGSENFKSNYGSGLGGHLLVLCIIIYIFFIGKLDKSKKLGILTTVILVVMIFLRQVKYAVILPLLAGLIYRILSGRIRISVSGVASLLFVIYMLFNMVYFLNFWTTNKNVFSNAAVYSFLLNHFFHYVIGGVLVLGKMVHEGIGTIQGDPQGVFAPFYNLYAVISSNEIIEPGNGYSAVISPLDFEESNVSTLFGPLLQGLGYQGALLYTFALGFVSYTTFAFAMLTRNCWAVVLWSFLAAMLALSWFGSYFTLLISIEAPAYCVILACLLWLPGKVMKNIPNKSENMALENQGIADQ